LASNVSVRYRIIPLIPVPDWFQHRLIFPFRYRTDQIPDSPAFYKKKIHYGRLRAENDMLDILRSSEIANYELRIVAGRCKELIVKDKDKDKDVYYPLLAGVLRISEIANY
jgi:hypothetical protein